VVANARERLPKLDDDVTVVQLNDREPQFLYRSSTTEDTPTRRSKLTTAP
jgi:hypothetical protein